MGRNNKSTQHTNTTTHTPPPVGSPRANRPSPEQVARRAYEIFLERGGRPGNDVEDWLQAERELSLSR